MGIKLVGDVLFRGLSLKVWDECSLMTNAHSEMGQIAVCCQNLLLGVLSSCSTPSLLVGELFKKFGLFLNTGVQWNPNVL
jgi:hypothetical protein